MEVEIVLAGSIVALSVRSCTESPGNKKNRSLLLGGFFLLNECSLTYFKVNYELGLYL